MDVKIDIVVPSYIKDINCIFPCIQNLVKQTILPSNIIITISEINNTLQKGLENVIENFKLPVNIILLGTEIKQFASQNRNRGIQYCKNVTKPDYIMFVDCDDITHTRKIEYFLKALTLKKNISLMTSEYAFGYEPYDIYSTFDINEASLLICTNSTTCTNLCTLPSTKIHHAHIIVKSEICYDINYNESIEMNRKEDGDFCQRVNTKYGNVYNLIFPLTHYFP